MGESAASAPDAFADNPSSSSAPQHEDDTRDTQTYREHLEHVTKLTYPIVLSEIFQNLLPVVDIAFVGQLDKEELAAAALATVWFNLWNATFLGFLTAIDTLLSQSFGAKKKDNFAICAGSSLVIVLLATFVVAGIIALCGPAMKLFNQDPGLADAAGRFAFRLIPGLFPYYMTKVLVKFLQTQDILAPGVWLGLCANFMNVLFNWSLIFAAGLGIAGAPWATSLTRVFEFVIITSYLFLKKSSLFKETWPRIARQNLTYEVLKPFWKLAISGALSITAEAWSFEVTTILAGLVGTVALDAHTITLTIATFIFLSFPFAIGIAASIRVGHLIGDQRPEDARRSAKASFMLSTSLQAVLSVVLWPCNDLLGNLFSSDEEVASLVAELIPISCIFMIGDAIQATSGGVLRGLGRQKMVLWLNILGFWAFAVPIGASLTFAVGLGVFGLWWGFVIGIYLSALISLWYLYYRVDWAEEARRTVKRLSAIGIITKDIEMTTEADGSMVKLTNSAPAGAEASD